MIRFSCELRSHGWAVAVVGDERSEALITASYLEDALCDFVEAVERLFATGSSECIWKVEPGLFHWKFSREGVRCMIQVFRDNEIEPLFSGADDLLQLSSEIENAFQKLLDDWGEEGYLNKWGYPFPKEAHRKLAQRIAIERRKA